MAPNETGRLQPATHGEELARSMSANADLSVFSLATKPGAHLTLSDLSKLARKLDTLSSEGYDGVVITTGTDTLEEVAFFLDLVFQDKMTVVVTGSMRSPGSVGTDASLNIASALSVAADALASRYSTLVVMNEEIHLGRYVSKRHTSRANAFSSEPLGPVGWLREGRPVFGLGPMLTEGTPLLSPNTNPARILVVPTGIAVDSYHILNCADGFDGAVVEGYGVGHVSDSLIAPIASLTSVIPVAFVSATRSGEVHRRTYGFEGSEHSLLSVGALWGGHLTSQKAAILLALAINSRSTQVEVCELFDDVVASLTSTSSIESVEA